MDLDQTLENLVLDLKDPDVNLVNHLRAKHERLTRIIHCAGYVGYDVNSGLLLAIEAYCLALWLLVIACEFCLPEQDNSATVARAEGVRHINDPLPICPYSADLACEVSRRCVDYERTL